MAGGTADNTTSAAVGYARTFSNTLCVYPAIRIFERGDYVNRPPSAIIAGHIARVDADKSWHYSPSNRRIFDIAGTTPPIDNRNSTTNHLNQQFVSTVVRRDNGRVITHYRVESIVTIYSDWTHTFPTSSPKQFRPTPPNAAKRRCSF